MTWLTGGHDNWFSISLEDPSFQLQFNRRAQTLYSEFTQAADVAVRLLYQDWKHRPLYLAMSGGIDVSLWLTLCIEIIFLLSRLF